MQLAFGLAGVACAQDLFDGAEQAVAIVEHGAIEFLALRLVNGARLQGFKIQAYGGDRGFQFVCHRVNESVMLGVAADLAHQECGIEHDSTDDHQNQNDSKEKQDRVAPAEQHPADVEH